MFKSIVFIDDNGNAINPFVCEALSSFIRSQVIVMTESMFNAIDEFDELCVDIKRAIVIGSVKKNKNYRFPIVEVASRKDCYAYVKQRKLPGQAFWFIGDIEMMNDLLWHGLISDIHVAFNRQITSETGYSIDWADYLIPNSAKFNLECLTDPLMQFELVSRVKSIFSCGQVLKHFLRRNAEESHLLEVMRDILDNGLIRANRTNVKVRSVFGRQLEYEMAERIDPSTGKSEYRLPLLTTKHMFTRGVFEELKWFLSGGTDANVLANKNVNIWKGNTTRSFLNDRGLKNYNVGETGPIYGFQWRHWGAEYEPGKEDYSGMGVDQVKAVIHSLKTDPYSRRHIINAWNVSDLDKMCIPPCHVLYQFFVHETNGQKYLSLMMYQRSCDVFLGMPFNLCSLGLLLMIISHQVGYKPYKIIHSIADMHIYETHIPAVKEQISRTPKPFPFVRFECEPKDVKDYEFSDIKINGYSAHSAIKAEMIA